MAPRGGDQKTASVPGHRVPASNARKNPGPIAKVEQLRRARYGQVKRFARIVNGYRWDDTRATVALRDTEQDRGILLALCALGMTGCDAMCWGHRLGADVVNRIIKDADTLTSLDVNGEWLGNQVQMDANTREHFKTWLIWPAGWTLDEVEARAEARDYRQKRVRRINNITTVRENEMDYFDRVKQRWPALLTLIPTDRTVTIVDLTARAARHPLFLDANGHRIKRPSLRAIITRMLRAPQARDVLIVGEDRRSNGRPQLHFRRRNK